MKLLENIQTLQTLQSPYPNPRGYLNIYCGAKNTIWITGPNRWITEVDRKGVILRRFVKHGGVRAVCINAKGDVVLLSTFRSSRIFLLKEHNYEVLLNLQDWRPRGICFGEDGDLFVSMRKKDLSESKVVRYREGEAIKEYQFDERGTNLYSLFTKYLLQICQNRNGDICVADSALNAVVVVNVEGMLKFLYRGNTEMLSGHFMPHAIATDINGLIMTNDLYSQSVHILDCDGNFLRLIENPTGDGGLSVDSENNLVLGKYVNGEIHIIKYWEQ